MMSKKLLILFVIVMLTVSLSESVPRVKGSNVDLARLLRILKAKRYYENDLDCDFRGCRGSGDCCGGYTCKGGRCSKS
ncbi:hypothetical protein AC249_AIPGENE23975 [Exaiptasia diaphana]|nr:hypothetical protein AC249_AIPGENE23975 [Exaiptasia diaphana]